MSTGCTGKILPEPFIASVFIVFSAVSNIETRENLAHSEDTVRVYSSMRVHNNPPVWSAYCISRQRSNVLNLQIGQYFPNTLYILVSIFCTDANIYSN